MKLTYFKIFYRNFLRYKINYILNITGLILGILGCILIGTLIDHELSYDQHFEDYQQIYRILHKIDLGDYVENSTSCPFPLASSIQTDYAHEIKNITRIYNNWGESYSILTNDQIHYKEKYFAFVDSSFFKVFSFKFLKGNPNTALKDPYAIVLTETVAKKYFRDKEPIGQSLKLNGKFEVIVTGIMKDPPSNTHFQFTHLCSMSTFISENAGVDNSWGWNPCWTYVKLTNNYSSQAFENDLQILKEKYIPEKKFQFKLQSIKDIHLNSNLDYEIQPNSSYSIIYILLGMAMFVLIVVVINFVNQSTTQSAERAKEIGIKKVLGAQSRDLYSQFLSETILLTFFALLIALLLVFPLTPWFNNITGENFSYSDFLTIRHLLFYIFLLLFVGIASGTYPAFYLSSLNSITAIKSSYYGGGKQSLVRKIFISIQYAIAILMISGTLIVFHQVKFLRSKSLGFTKENIIILDVQNTNITKQYDAFVSDLEKHSQIKTISSMEYLFGYNYKTNVFFPEGLVEEDEKQLFPFVTVQYDFFETFNIATKSGRTFNRKYPSDPEESIIINESMVKTLGWTDEDAIGRKFGFRKEGNQKVIGVINDYHFSSLHSTIQPLVIRLSTDLEDWSGNYLAIKYSGDPTIVISFVKEIWDVYERNSYMDFFFLDSKLNSLYKTEEQLGQISSAFSFIAISIACLGILGLIMFLTKQRLKEIAIRRILGSSTVRIVILFSNQFLLLIGLGSLIAWSVGYFGMKSWLQGFAYHAEIEFAFFLFATLSMITITECIILYHSIRVCLYNPCSILIDQ